MTKTSSHLSLICLTALLMGGCGSENSTTRYSSPGIAEPVAVSAGPEIRLTGGGLMVDTGHVTYEGAPMIAATPREYFEERVAEMKNKPVVSHADRRAADLCHAMGFATVSLYKTKLVEEGQVADLKFIDQQARIRLMYKGAESYSNPSYSMSGKRPEVFEYLECSKPDSSFTLGNAKTLQALIDRRHGIVSVASQFEGAPYLALTPGEHFQRMINEARHGGDGDDQTIILRRAQSYCQHTGYSRVAVYGLTFIGASAGEIADFNDSGVDHDRLLKRMSYEESRVDGYVSMFNINADVFNLLKCVR